MELSSSGPCYRRFRHAVSWLALDVLDCTDPLGRGARFRYDFEGNLCSYSATEESSATPQRD